MKIKNWLLIPVLALFAIFIVFYIYQIVHFGKYFLPNTHANNVNISNLTVAEANQKLTTAFDNDSFQILENGQPWQEVSKKELGLNNDFQPSLKAGLKKQNKWFWWLAADTTVKMNDTTLDKAALDQATVALREKITGLNAGRTPTENATITKGASGFEIVPEKAGNTLNVDEIIPAIQKSVADGNSAFELEEHIQKPTVLADNPELKNKIADMNKLVNESYNYSINGTQFEIPKDTIMSWVIYDGNEITLDQAAVTNYVTELGAKYNTSTNPSSFVSTKRGTVSVPPGAYGWTIQTEPEVAELTKEILAGKGFTRTPITQGSGTAGAALIGKTYIEVDLVNQHMWYYKDGAVQIETPVITGKPSTPTPAGVNYVWKKERNSILVGEDYKTPVDYWMPIDWEGVGIHDSPWQNPSAYGGNSHLTVGSHGCINTPPAIAGQLFNAIDEGVPVVVF